MTNEITHLDSCALSHVLCLQKIQSTNVKQGEPDIRYEKDELVDDNSE